MDSRRSRSWLAHSAAALVLLAGAAFSPAHAAVPALGSREGELLCAGLTNVLASGALLTTGGDALPAAKAHGVFLGRLSVIAPDAKYRLPAFLETYDKMTPAEQAQLLNNCLTKLKEIDGVGLGDPEPTAR